nr:putative HAD-superfamily hydrolase, subfamily IIA [Ipomoea batatas]
MQVLQGHSPFKNLLKRFENELIVATGKGEPAKVMSEYGFKKVLSVEEYASYFHDIDPVAQYKNWKTEPASILPKNSSDLAKRYDVFSDKVKAAFVVSDPVDWGRDIQVVCSKLSAMYCSIEKWETKTV